PCAMYSETGFNAQARTKLHDPVWPLQRRSNSTALVWAETYKRPKAAALRRPSPEELKESCRATFP
ncbi:MAG: hypothetical protein ABIX12_06445, partial [Rubrivivax sp.]